MIVVCYIDLLNKINRELEPVFDVADVMLSSEDNVHRPGQMKPSLAIIPLYVQM